MCAGRNPPENVNRTCGHCPNRTPVQHNNLGWCTTKRLEKAFVSPIFKKGARNLAFNYRPISLTSILYNLIEKIVRRTIMDHLSTKKLLSEKQHGFINGHSTTTQLLKYLDECVQTIVFYWASFKPTELKVKF